MCLICVELTKNKLTATEARRNLGELVDMDIEHRVEVLRNIWKKEDQENKLNEEDQWLGWGSD